MLADVIHYSVLSENFHFRCHRPIANILWWNGVQLCLFHNCRFIAEIKPVAYCTFAEILSVFWHDLAPIMQLQTILQQSWIISCIVIAIKYYQYGHHPPYCVWPQVDFDHSVTSVTLFSTELPNFTDTLISGQNIPWQRNSKWWLAHFYLWFWFWHEGSSGYCPTCDTADSITRQHSWE